MTVAIVCGGRDYTDRARIKRVLDAAVERLGLHLIIEGAGGRERDGVVEQGADLLAREWAVERGDVSVIEVQADWDRLRRGAGPVRNAQMLKILKAAEAGERLVVIAFPGGDGTADMCGRADKAGIEVMRV